jgi:hypothetical protein
MDPDMEKGNSGTLKRRYRGGMEKGRKRTEIACAHLANLGF